MNPSPQQQFQIHKAYAPKLADLPLKHRLQRLSDLRNALKGAHGQQLIEALHKDFGKSETEATLTELLPTLDNLKLILKKLKKWTAPQKVRTPLPLLGSSSYVQAEPKGTTLVISPWNYPVFLSLHPLCSSIAAGNTVILKPSELTPHTSDALAELIQSVFPPEEAVVLTGGVEVGKALLELPFNHIFFTGSTAVGKKVMEAASKHLTSVTLELGGKSPTIVDKSANGYTAGERIAWAKYTNSGQICIAPDHIYVHKSQIDAFTKGITETLLKLYGDRPSEHRDYVQIVNDRHFDRLSNLRTEALQQSGLPIYEGQANDKNRKIEPLIILDPPKDGALMREEIFGPLLPVFTFDDLSEPLQEINSRPQPLVVYIYAKNMRTVKFIQRATRAGASAVNMSLLQVANNFLPFGGVGESGMGKTNGESGFKEFSNMRSHFYQWGPAATKLLAPPFTAGKLKAVKTLIKMLY